MPRAHAYLRVILPHLRMPENRAPALNGPSAAGHTCTDTNPGVSPSASRLGAGAPLLEKRVAREFTMKRSMMGWAIVCLLGLVGCTIERYDDDCADYDDDDGFGHGASSSGGKSGAAGSGNAGHSAGTDSGTGSAGTDSAGTGNGGSSSSSGGSAAQGGSTAEPAPEPCAEERDCAPGYNCDAGSRQCLPSEQETCGELTSEQACNNRRDCAPVYGGINCSCGADCECVGGEPGCVCESFEFFACRAGE
jgi:hypothetical protein